MKLSYKLFIFVMLLVTGLTTAALIIGVGVVNHSHWVFMLLLLVIWRIAQNYFTYPRIMGRQLEIHPLAAIFAVLVGAEIGGIVGIYLAVPVAAALRVVWRIYAVPKESVSLAAGSMR